MTEKMSTKNLLQWIASLGLPALVMFVPVNDAFTNEMKLYIAITLLGILFLAFGNIKQTVVTFMLPWLYVFSGITTTDVVFRPWTMATIWMFIGSFFLINALNRCGLLNRIAYKTIILFGGSYYGIYVGLVALCLVLALATGGNGTIPMLALAMGICQALNLEKFSKEATSIFLVAAVGGAIPGYAIYNAATLIIISIGSSVGGPTTIGWFQHLLYGVPFLIYFVLSVILAVVMFRADDKSRFEGSRAYFQEKYQALGVMTSAEKKALALVVAMLVYMMTASFTGGDASYGFIIFPVLAYLPGIEVGTEDDLKRIDFGFILFVAACLGIGMTGGSLGFGELVSNTLLPLLQDKGAWVFAGAVWLLCFVMNFLLTPMAIYASFAAPLTAISLDLGINPLATYFLMYLGADQVFFPYECALYLLFFSYGVIRMKDFIKYFAARTVLSIFVLFAIMLPFYALIGYLYI